MAKPSLITKVDWVQAHKRDNQIVQEPLVKEDKHGYHTAQGRIVNPRHSDPSINWPVKST